MRNEAIEQKIKQAAERLTPDVRDGILSRCDEPQRNIYLIQPGGQKRGWVRSAGLLAAALAVVFAGFFTSERIGYNRISALVMLDVNPSIAMELNRDDRVLDVKAGNEDAVIILDQMDLINVPVDVATNALIGSMLKFGYIHENANSVLLSVESADGEKSAVLQRDLTQSISRQLNPVNGAVISQHLTNDQEIRALAEAHQISYGKAALVQKILDQNGHLLFTDLARLTVNELNLLVDAKQIEAEGMAARGRASDVAYIGEESAEQAALEHAGVNAYEIERLQTELDYDDGLMIYDVEFFHEQNEYEYEINALDGAVLQSDRETKKEGENEDIKARPTASAQAQNRADFIGEHKAIEIAQTHAGVQAPDDLDVELDKDDGLYLYEIEFKAGGKEYDYEINATGGEILSWEAKD